MCYCGDNKYTTHDIARTERILLNTVSFRLNEPTVFDFLVVYLKFVEEFSSKVNVLRSRRMTLTATYIAEIALHGSTHVNFPPSLIAASIVTLTLHIACPKSNSYPAGLQSVANRKLEELRDCAYEIWSDGVSMQTGMHGWDVMNLNCVRKKYEKQERLGVGGEVCFKRVLDWEEIDRSCSDESSSTEDTEFRAVEIRTPRNANNNNANATLTC